MDHLSALTRTEVADRATEAVAVLPIASHEQHGEHLPLGTDTLLAQAVVERALTDREDVVLCPPLPYGFSGHHQFACALSLRPATLLQVLGDLLDSLVDAGFTRILVVNGHGGNSEMMSQAVKLAALRHRVVAGFCNYWDLLDGHGGPGHAGRFETDLMAAAHPELVRPGGTGPTELPLFDQRLVPGLHVERHGEWGRTGGVTDPPGPGDAEAGERQLTAAAHALAACIDALRETAVPTDVGAPGATDRPAIGDAAPTTDQPTDVGAARSTDLPTDRPDHGEAR